jgi:hypothetical protein
VLPVDHWAWEFRLSARGGPVDLQLALAQDPASRAFALAATDACSDPALAAVLRQLRPWFEGRLDPWVSAAFVELDAQHGAKSPLPLAFLKLRPLDPVAQAIGAAALVEQLAGAEEAAAFASPLFRLVSSLPAGALTRYVAPLNARGARIVRWAASFPVVQLSSWLHAIGWPGDAEATQAEVLRLNPWTSHQLVMLDVAPDGLAPRLGVEFFWHRSRADDPRMLGLLTELATWPDLDPARVAFARRWALGQDVAPGLSPDLYIKLTFDGTRREVKSYLGCHTRSWASGT